MTRIKKLTKITILTIKNNRIICNKTKDNIQITLNKNISFMVGWWDMAPIKEKF